MFLATLTNVGRAAMAASLKAQGLSFAWGEGSAEWAEDDFAASLRGEQALSCELGRRLPNQVDFLTPDPAGEVTLPIAKDAEGEIIVAHYRISPEPTPYLYLRVSFDFGEASTAVIREAGIFVGARAKAGLPPGQRYFTPDELDYPGLLLAAQRLEPVIQRDPAVRQMFEFVLQV